MPVLLRSPRAKFHLRVRQTHRCVTMFKKYFKYLECMLTQGECSHLKREKIGGWGGTGQRQNQNPSGQTLSPVNPCSPGRGSASSEMWIPKGLGSPHSLPLLCKAHTVSLWGWFCSYSQFSSAVVSNPSSPTSRTTLTSLLELQHFFWGFWDTLWPSHLYFSWLFRLSSKNKGETSVIWWVLHSSLLKN